ncbi:ATP-binding protein [Candidatus Woesearchaeota archaeon]|nr:ATP-binding protein [Candidatus Woesearchaeota archaeon]
MKFYNREEELRSINRFIDQSAKKSFLLVFAGRRRIGKTRLVSEALAGVRYLDFFVPVKEKGLVLSEFKAEVAEKLGYSPEFPTVESFLEYLFTQKDNLCIFFDEFQNMLRVDEGFFHSFQKYWDKYKDQKKFRVFISGSYVGTIKRIFQDKKAPLFGRADAFFKIRPLGLPTILQILTDLGIKEPEQQFLLYGIFGGIPRYYEFIETASSRNFWGLIEELFTNEGSVLVYEGKNILIEEFGKRYKLYFSILEAVAHGKTSLTGIADTIQQKPGTITKHMILLEDYYEILGRKYPITEKKSKKSRYGFNDYFLQFWFRFIQHNWNLLEENQRGLLLEIVKRDFSQYFGWVFEQIVQEFIYLANKSKVFGEQFEAVGSWWDKGKEIDIVAFNEHQRSILFGECKWQASVNAKSIIAELAKKTEHVQWYNGKRKECFAVFAKSFSKRMTAFEGRPVLCLDLVDMINILISTP